MYPQVLFGVLARQSGLVCAKGIKHLDLMMSDPDCDRLSSAVSGLEQLETLCLIDLGRASEACGALQLSALCNLQRLKLKYIVPESISCSDSCELHVDLDVGWSLRHPVWDTVLPRLRSVTINSYSRKLAVLPSILLKAGNLFKADVRVQRCGKATAPVLLGGSLAHVDDLVLSCVELHAVVPAHVTWCNVYLAATHLNLRFEAVAPFGEVIPAFCFLFKELQVCYPQPSLYLFIAITVPHALSFLCDCPAEHSSV